ncbi:MAG: ATP-grasp domain-containing protein, partial [Planctomycetota bacterium]
LPNREKYGQEAIKRITNGLKKGGHQVLALEGDKDLIKHLEEFMPQVLIGERPGMVFNLSYGIQGQARYTHVPGILEMIGIPYVGSGPLAHSLALDKVVAKMIFRQHGLPTPEFAVLDDEAFAVPDIPFPLIVKPKNEAVSFGLRIVDGEAELREAAVVIFKEYQQPVLAEQYIEGREINVGLLGNNPPEALPPVEILFGEGGPAIYTLEDKTHVSDREIRLACPAPVEPEVTERARELALKAFSALGCFDSARVDMRLNAEGKLYILELNSLPSLGVGGSFVAAAAQVGLDYAGLVNRLVEVASARYFGTPTPPTAAPKGVDQEGAVFRFLTQRRDRIEHRIRAWTRISSRTEDPIGLTAAAKKLGETMKDIGLQPSKEFTDGRTAWFWETKKGFDDGILFAGHLDVPVPSLIPLQAFRREPEWLVGEGIGCSRAPLVMLEFALRAVRSLRVLHRLPLGVFYCADEGRDGMESARMFREAASRARRVLVLRPGNLGDRVITGRRGQRKYRFVAEGKPHRIGKAGKKADLVRWMGARIEEFSRFNSHKRRTALSATDLRTQAFPMYEPHRVEATVVLTFADPTRADDIEKTLRDLLDTSGGKWELEKISDRPPMRESGVNNPLVETFREVAGRWEIPFEVESSLWPSLAGLVPEGVEALCGIGPVATNLYTPQEAVRRITILQRTLLLAQFLVRNGKHDRTTKKNAP